MVIVAVVAALYAVLSESEDHRDRSSAGAGTPLVVLLGLRADAGAAEFPWSELVRTELANHVEVYDATSPSARVNDYRGAGVVDIFQRPPAVAVIWLGVDDFLLGLDLGAFERSLGHLLSSLAAERISLVALTLPDLEPLMIEGGTPQDELVAARAEIRRWNATIARLAAAYHAHLLTTADLLAGLESATLSRTPDEGGWALSAEGHEAIATAVASLITGALAARRSSISTQPTA